MTKNKKLSVVLATFNEEKNLRACLEGVRDLADEIIVVDGSSTDKTIEIAKSFGAKIKITTNKSNFHINKQMAIDMAKFDWILQLDADERVSKELSQEIKSEIQNPKLETNGFWMSRKNYFLGRFLMKGGQYPDYTLRLYRKGKGRLPQKDVHEQAEVDGRVNYLKNALLHYPYENFGSYLSKWNRYNDLIAEQIREEMRKNISAKIYTPFAYLFFSPIVWFLSTFIRHKGFVDGWQGFTFSFFSALRFPVSYLKYLGLANISLILILLLSVFVRFYNFNLRWEMAGDDSRDALIALEALKRHAWPATGSFSSAGPFVFGGMFYWFVMLSYICLPHLINAPWILTDIAGVITVLLLIFIGNEIGGKKLAILVGLLAATSGQLVARSTIVGQHTLVSTAAVFQILFVLLLWRTRKKFFAFLAGISLGFALSFHYQALNLLIFFPALFFIPKLNIKDKTISLFLMIIGFLIPLSPLLYWDAKQSFANLRNLADYFLIGQERIYVPNSWKLFIFKYLPGYWSFVVGSYQSLALLNSIISFGVFSYYLIKRNIPGKIAFLGIIFSLLLILNRYYRGERSESYLLYLIPFILVLTAWSGQKLIFNSNKIARISGIIFIGAILVGNVILDLKIINFRSQYPLFRMALNNLYINYPNAKFDLYDYKYKEYSISMPLSLIMSFDGKQDSQGKKVGITCIGKDCSDKKMSVIIGHPFLMVNLDDQSKFNSSKLWVNVDRESVYEDLLGWLSKNQLKSSFSFQDYIKSKIGI